MIFVIIIVIITLGGVFIKIYILYVAVIAVAAVIFPIIVQRSFTVWGNARRVAGREGVRVKFSIRHGQIVAGMVNGGWIFSSIMLGQIMLILLNVLLPLKATMREDGLLMFVSCKTDT